MRRFNLLFFITFSLAILNACSAKEYGLKEIQGVWWSDCEDPAGEFYIEGNEYSGDFDGSHPLTLKGNIITFQNGFVEGHDIYVSFKPIKYLILNLSNESMLLESNLKKDNQHRWLLHSCLNK